MILVSSIVLAHKAMINSLYTNFFTKGNVHMKRFSQYLLTVACTVAMQTALFAKVTEVTSASQLDAIIKDNDFVVVKFWMKGCPPCNALKGPFDQVANELGDDVAFVAVKGPSELSDKYNIKGFPTVLYFKDGSNKSFKKGSSRTASALQQEVESAFGL